jgi:hypothetical protein
MLIRTIVGYTLPTIRAAVALDCPLGALPHLGLARECALQPQSAKGIDADPDIPVLNQAKLDLAKLQ